MKEKGISRNTLKIIAMGTMLADHIGALFTAPTSTANMILRGCIGRISFPLFVILFAEGFCKTKRPWIHIRDLAIFAILSEYVYDITLNMGAAMQKQNVMFSWLLGFCMLYVIKNIDEYMEKKTDPMDIIGHLTSNACIVLVFAMAAILFNVSYKYSGILSMAFGYYLFKYAKHGKIAAVSVTSTILFAAYKTPGVFLSIPIYMLYNENKKCMRTEAGKYAAYAFYPIHIAILHGVRTIIR